MKTGLSYFENGGGVEQSTDLQEQPGVRTKSGKSSVIANESVLQQMQNLYSQKQAQQQGLGGFIETLKDATAWTSGGVHGPTEALAKRADDKSKRAAELFDMQNKIASQRAAIDMRNRFFGTQPTDGGVQPVTVNSQPTAGGVQPTTGGAAPGVAEANQQSGGLLGLVQDPALRQSIGMTFLQDPDKAMTVLNGYLSKRAEEPQIRKEVNYLVSLGMDPKKALEVALTKVVGAGAFVPSDVRTPGGTVQKTPLDSANQFVGGASTTVAPGGGASTTVAPTTVAPAGGASTTVAPAGGASTTAPAPAIRTPQTKLQTSSTTSNVAQNTTAQPQFQFKPTGFTPGSEEDLKAKQLQFENSQKSVGSESEGRGKTDATTAEALETAGAAADKNIRTYEMVQNILHETPRAVGIAYRSGPGSAAIKFVEEGATIPFAGSLKIPGMEEAVARGTLTDKELQNRATFNALVGDLAMAYKRDANKGMGSQSDADAKAAETAFGISSKNPAKSNLILAILQMEK